MSAPQASLFGSPPPAPTRELRVCASRMLGPCDAVTVDEAGWEEAARGIVRRERLRAHAYTVSESGAWDLVHTMDVDGTVLR